MLKYYYLPYVTHSTHNPVVLSMSALSSCALVFLWEIVFRLLSSWWRARTASTSGPALTVRCSAAPPSISASKRSIRRFAITKKAPTRAFSWLKAATTTFTFKTLLRHYAKRTLTPQSLNVKLGPRRNYHKGRAAIRHYANQTARPLWPLRRGPNFTLRDRGVKAR